MSTARSSLAPKKFPKATPLTGVKFATAEAGIKYQNRRDVLLVALDEGTTIAGVFTKSKCPSAAIDWCRASLNQGKARALVVNSGNANAFTGEVGAKAARETAEAAAVQLKCKPEEVFIASTGVIGEPLDASKIVRVMGILAKEAKQGEWLDAASAIMTTDTFPKLATRTVKTPSGTFTITGVAKGAGMIAPDMATMLSFIFTDAKIDAALLQKFTSKAVKETFNCLTIDGDTSTSDTLLVFATGKSVSVKEKSKEASRFYSALKKVMQELSILVAKDGEGARKFITVEVEGAKGKRAAHNIAMSIANSPLVKTAVAGEDANWGRVVMAVGKAGEMAERDKLSIYFGSYKVADKGLRAKNYSEEAVSTYMKGQDIRICVDLGIGRGRAKVWTCDLTKDYVAINGDYRS